MLNYLASGSLDALKQGEILRQIVASNKAMLTGLDHLINEASTPSDLSREIFERDAAIAKHLEELERTNIELKAIARQREDFVAALSHDLKNPLIGSTRVLECLAGGMIEPKEQTRIFGQLIESNKNMLKMIWNLLGVYKHDSGCLVPVSESVDIVKLLKDCLEDFSFSITTKNISVAFEAPNQLPQVLTDSVLLRRVLINLLDNGIKFTPEFGNLTVSLSSEGKHVTIAVKDSGIGMSATQTERVFLRCFPSTSSHGSLDGSGIGLFLSQQIMQLLGGKIECTSNETGGTQFTVTLPITTVERAEILSPA